MSDPKLPQQASLEYLKKLAKDRLRDLRRADPQAKLAAALLALAHEYGFPVGEHSKQKWMTARPEILPCSLTRVPKATLV